MHIKYGYHLGLFKTGEEAYLKRKEFLEKLFPNNI